MKRKKTIRAGRLVQTIIYSAVTIADKMPHVRAQKSKCSTEAQRRMNHKHSWQKLETLLAANFDEGDFVVTLTYSDEELPYCRKLAVDRMRRHLRKIREAKGRFPYIYVTEEKHGDGRLHHHIVVKGEDVEAVKAWKWGSVSKIEPLDIYGYEALAKYLTKEAIERKRPGRRTWSESKGLTRPTVETEICKDDTDIAVPAGCIILNGDSKQYEFGSWRYIKYLEPKQIRYRQTRPPRRKTE